MLFCDPTFQFVSCFLRRVTGNDFREIAIPSGFLAGLSMLFYSSKPLSIYATWKTLEVKITYVSRQFASPF